MNQTHSFFPGCVANRQRAIKRGDSGPKNSLDTAPINGAGGGRKETAREERKRGETDRVTLLLLLLLFLTLALKKKERWGARGLKTRHTRPHEETEKNIGYKTTRKRKLNEKRKTSYRTKREESVEETDQNKIKRRTESASHTRLQRRRVPCRVPADQASPALHHTPGGCSMTGGENKTYHV